MVRMKGLEPSHLAAPDPKSGVSTNFTTSAHVVDKFLMSLLTNSIKWYALKDSNL